MPASLAQYAGPIAFVVAGIAAGVLAERLVLPRLSRPAGGRESAGGHLVLSSLRGVVIVWCVAAGAYAAVLALTARPPVLSLAHKLLLIVLIPSATLVVARIAGSLVTLYSHHLYRRRGTSGLPSLTIITNLARLLVFVIGGLVVLESLGIAISPILTALGVGGLAVALALQDTLSNLFAGLFIIASRQIKPGDYVRLSTGEEGYVVDITWRNTKIKELPNNMVIVPNAKLATSTITNCHQPDREVVVPVQASVSYESDLGRVELIALEVARAVMREVQGGVPESEPVLRYFAFGESSIDFRVLLRARDVADQYRVRHEFVKRLHERFRREGIAFRSLSEVYVKEPERTRRAGTELPV